MDRSVLRALRFSWLALLSLSLALLAAGVLVSPSRPALHIRLVVTSVLVFYATVAAAYLASAAGGSRLAALLGTLHAPLYALTLLSWRLGLLAGSAVGAAATACAALAARREGRVAAASLIPVYALGLYAGAAWRLLDPVSWGVAALAAVPAAAVAPVNLYAVTRTYRVGPRLLPPLASIAYAAVVALLGPSALRYYAPIYGAMLLALTAMAARSRVYLSARGPARAAHRYVLLGQLFTGAAALAYPAAQGLLAEAHMLAMGYIAMHVCTHAPLMIPPMLSKPSPRRYTPLPHALQAAALAARLHGPGHAAILLELLALASLLYATLPAPKPPGSAGARRASSHPQASPHR